MIQLVLDVNHDGLADLVEQENGRTFVSFSDGQGLEQRQEKFGLGDLFNINQDIVPEFDTDINGDGINDKVKFDTTGVHTALGQLNGVLSAMSKVYAGFGRDAGGWSTNNTFPRYMADINGDGMADIVGFASNGIYTALSRGDGSFATAQKAHDSFGTRAGGWVSDDKYPRFVTDVNNDGMADIVGFGSTYTFVALAEGDGTFSSNISSLSTGFNYNDGWTSNSSHQRLMADIDGDGKSDIIGVTSSGDMYISTTAKEDKDVIDGGAGDDLIESGSGDDILRGGDGADTYVARADDTGTKTIDLSSSDGSSVDTLKFEGVQSEDLEFQVDEDDLTILFKDDPNDLSYIIEDYYTAKFWEDDSVEKVDQLKIETDDAVSDIKLLGDELRRLRELSIAEQYPEEAKNNSDSADTDGGSVDGANQVNTEVDSSELLDIWLPKKNGIG